LNSAFQVETSDILVADHGSTDKTLQVAQSYSKMQVRTIDASFCKNIAEVRQTLIDHSKSLYSVWLDADDELLPGRVKRIINSLENNQADIYFDASKLVRGNQTKTLPMPNFASSNPEAHCRNFERCFLPAPGVPGVRTEFAKKIGFDPDFETAEDYDFLLRASMSGGKFCFDPKVGYRQHHSSTTLSRNLDRQKKFTALALQKHPLEKIGRLYESNGWCGRIQAWSKVQILTFLSDFSEALVQLAELERTLIDPLAILEPHGVYPYPEGWLINFWKGSVQLKLGNFNEAMVDFLYAEEIMPMPEISNNLGVVFFSTGKINQAKEQFKKALTQKPDYIDAKENLKNKSPNLITNFPFRYNSTRSDY
jgi:glycosyltransferase involved in cell wall biosynthesis